MFSDITGLIFQLIVGLIVGVIARLILPGREALPAGALGWLVTAIIGIAGAFVGTMVARILPFTSANYTAGWIMSIIGAVLLLLIVRMIFGRGGTPS
ncbi:MAG: GlsB/YeaQ/YmgE family stress response membrane protein [Pyrinomonadaceae bacterium]